MSKPAIICVDDEPIVLESLKIELRHALGDSCLIETAESGEEALELFEELQTDRYEIAVVLADQSMPGLRGDELLKQIHQLSPQTLNIMITGHANLDTLDTVIRTAKLYRYIAKPWKSDDLRSTVLEAIRNYYHMRQLEQQNLSLQKTVHHLEQTIADLQQSQTQLWQQTQQQEALNRVFVTFAIQQFQACQSVQEQVENLEQLNHLKDHFLSAVSRELRAPISNIRMATQMLEVRLQQLGIYDDLLQCNKYFRILRTECQRETDLIDDLLTLIRLDSHAESLSLAAVNLNLWIPHIVEPFMEQITAHQQQLQISLPTDLPALVTDLSHLERTLTELFSNACKYTPEQEVIGVTVELVQPASIGGETIEHSDRPIEATIPSMVPTPPSPEIWIRVSNSGVEISAEEQVQIFDQFYRIPHHNFWNQSGTGLGLSIVKKRVEKLRGTITVQSHSQQTTFTVKLPLHLDR
jgi:signal transduction histidine kinase